MKSKIDYSLYLVTDRYLVNGNIFDAVEDSIKGGCTLVQLREKDISSLDFYNTAIRIKKITDKYKIPLIINDRVDIALAVDAEGVHVGNSDLPVREVRKIIGENKIIGVSASNIKQAVKAKEADADYIGVGAIFTTNTKNDADSVSIQTLKDIKNTVDLPIVAIGGINKNNLNQLASTKIDGIALISAILCQDNITEATKELKDMFLKL